MIDEFFAYMFSKAEESFIGMLALTGILLTSFAMFTCMLVLIVGYTPWLIPLGMVFFVVHQVKGFLNHRKKWNEDWEKEHDEQMKKMKESANDLYY